jgi:hypothetical protein
MDAASISTPEYFSSTFGVDAATAASLSQQASAAGTRGVGLYAPPAAPVPGAAPATPGTAVPSLQAQYDENQAARAAGKITQYEYRAREREIADAIANGGTAPAPNTSASTDPMAEHFAPPAQATDYRFPAGDGTPTDEMIATDRALKEAMHAAHLPRSAVESILQNASAAARAIAANPETLQARLDSNKVRMTEMWAREGIDWDTAQHTIDLEIARWPEALQEQFRKIGPLLGPTDWDQVLQLAMYRNRTRAA